MMQWCSFAAEAQLPSWCCSRPERWANRSSAGRKAWRQRVNANKSSAERAFLLDFTLNFQAFPISLRKQPHHHPSESNCNPHNTSTLSIRSNYATSHNCNVSHSPSLRNAPANFHCSAMSTRRTRRAAAAAEVTEEVITIETRSKRTRAAPRKTASTTAAPSTKSTKSSTRAKRTTTPQPDDVANTRANVQTATRQNAVASTPAPATNNKRRLRSTATDSASPLRALDEQPAKRQRTISRKAPSRSTSAKSVSSQEDDDEEETPVFFTKSMLNVRRPPL